MGAALNYHQTEDELRRQQVSLLELSRFFFRLWDMRKRSKETEMFGRHGVVLDAVPTSSEILSPQQYLKLDRAQREKIQEVKIAPARLGEKSFGGLLVRYKYPTYKVSP